MKESRQERLFQAAVFRDYLRDKLIKLLDSIPGKKLLMLDSSVRNSVNLVIQKKAFSEHGVPQEGILPFQVTRIDNNFNQVVIILPPTIKSMQTLANLYDANKDRAAKTYFAVFSPKKSLVCKQFLESRGLLGSFELKDFSFDLIPLDNDLYSLEMKCFKELYIDQQYKIYNYVAESIVRLQSVFGKVRNIFGKGSAARNVYQILQIKQVELKLQDTYGDIEHLILFDRNIDFVTPLLKQMTYQGMIDEQYGFTGNFVKLPSQMLSESKNSNQPYKLISLSGEKDFVYEDVRILMITACRSILKNKLLNIDKLQNEYKESTDIKYKADLTKRITTQKEFLTKHINISSSLAESMKTISFHKQLMMMQRCILGNDQKEILEYYECMIPFGLPLQKILRPLCLNSLVYKGISKKIYPNLCTDILECYGAQHLVTIGNLAKLGMFNQQGQYSTSFTQVRKQLKLINEDPINHEFPNDISFAYGGYAAICPKLVQNVIRNGWKGIPKALKYLPGQTLMPDMVIGANSAKPVILVYFIGGVTYGQIAAIRLLSKLFKREIIVATTQILNGQSIIKSLIYKD